MELKNIKGLGKKRISALNEASVFSCLDLLNHFPNKYYDFSNISCFDKNKKDVISTISGKVISEPKGVYAFKLNYVIVKIKDNNSDSTFNAVWYNQPYIKNSLKNDENYIFYGRVNSKNQFVVQKYFSLESDSKSFLFPAYKSIAGIGSKLLSAIIKQVLNDYNFATFLPQNIEELTLKQAYTFIHQPQNVEEIERGKARVSLEDMMLLAAAQTEVDIPNKPKKYTYDKQHLNTFKNLCPFSLTKDQNTAIEEISEDMTSSLPMNRLLLGDVGSGKTMVAFASCFLAIKSGYQAVLLAPTEILAKQHFMTASKLFDSQNIETCLLHSKLSQSSKTELEAGIEEGRIKLIIGTHSVFSDSIKFKNLSLVITDEQHRFGVSQRAALSKKAIHPDTLIMSATPIPRSLSLVFFGGLKTSKLLERPMGKSIVKTNIVSYDKIDALYSFLKDEIQNKNASCFIIVPRIEDSEDSNLHSIEYLKSIFDNSEFFRDKYQIVYGGQDQNEQQIVLDKFKSKKYPILIATTVVEVGIDITTASIMIIHNADRFGFATLHQLRGRIGRDGNEGQCFCLTDGKSETALKRLRFFKNNNDGFVIAEEDFKTRGAGTIIGTQQHGMSEIISNQNFSVEEFKKAQKLVKTMSKAQLIDLKKHSQQKFGDIFKKIVMN